MKSKAATPTSKSTRLGPDTLQEDSELFRQPRWTGYFLEQIPTHLSATQVTLSVSGRSPPRLVRVMFLVVPSSVWLDRVLLLSCPTATMYYCYCYCVLLLLLSCATATAVVCYCYRVLLLLLSCTTAIMCYCYCNHVLLLSCTTATAIMCYCYCYHVLLLSCATATAIMCYCYCYCVLLLSCTTAINDPMWLTGLKAPTN